MSVGQSSKLSHEKKKLLHVHWILVVLIEILVMVYEKIPYITGYNPQQITRVAERF